MRYLVAYDISDDRRRAAIADTLCGFGDRVQYSVFEVDVDRAALAELADRLYDQALGPVDSIRVYRLCGGCVAASHVIGSATLRQAPIAWIV